MQKLNETELKYIIGGDNEHQPVFYRLNKDGSISLPCDPNEANALQLENGTWIYMGSGPA